MSNYSQQLHSILLKDFKLELSYKGRFLYSVFFIFLQLTIFYFLAAFLNIEYKGNDDSGINNLFGFFLVGICFLDVSYTIISYQSIRIEEYKKVGVFEELFVLPINPIVLIIFSNIYPVLFSIFKIFIYLFAGIILFDLELLDVIAPTLLLVTSFFAIIIFIGISLIASAMSILFYRGSFVSVLHNTLSILFGGILYSASSVIKDLSMLEYFIPLSSILNLVRHSFSIIELNNNELNFNVMLIIIHAIIFILVGSIILRYSIKKAIKEGRLSLY